MADPNPTEIPFNEWKTEEKRLPTIVLDVEGKRSIGERVVTQRYAYVPLIPHQICSSDDHSFGLVDDGRRQPDGRVLVKCQHCPVGRIFVVGKHKIKDGMLVPFHQPRGLHPFEGTAANVNSLSSRKQSSFASNSTGDSQTKLECNRFAL